MYHILSQQHINPRADQQRQRREAEEKLREIELCIIKSENNKPMELNCSTMVCNLKSLNDRMQIKTLIVGSFTREKEKRNLGD